jgi:hypothetical protein
MIVMGMVGQWMERAYIAISRLAENEFLLFQ